MDAALIQQQFNALRAEIAANDRRYEEGRRASEEALRVAQQAVELRLEATNRWREQYTDLFNRSVGRQEIEVTREGLREKIEQLRLSIDARFDAELKPVNSKLEIFGRPNWAFLTSAMAVFLVMVGGVWGVIGLKIDAAVAPVHEILSAMRVDSARTSDALRNVEVSAASSVQADTTSRADRTQLNERLRLIENLAPAVAEVGILKSTYGQVSDRLQGIRTEQAKMQAALVEIETQFCGADNLRSQIHANDLRVESMLWRQVFNVEMPISNAFYARVGRCGPPAGG